MRISMTIDGTAYNFNASSDKPLHRILLEISDSFAANNSCQGAKCGNCIVLLNEQCVLSCLVPACRLNGAEVVTFESFKQTRAYHDIEKAYQDCGTSPCPQCYAAKTLLIESLVRKLETQQGNNRINARHANVKNIKPVMDLDFIAREVSINSCNCIEASQIETIIKLACQNRRRRSNGRS